MSIIVSQKNKTRPLPVETDNSNHNVVAEYGDIYSKDDIALAKQKLIQARNVVVNRNHFFLTMAMQILFADASSWLKTYSMTGTHFYFNTGYVFNTHADDLADFFEEELKCYALNFLAMKTVF
jgi:hypothetical protein